MSQSQRQILRDHGRNHLPGGTDPIPGITVGIETGSVTFTAAEVLAGATKTILSGIPGRVLYPLDYLMAISGDFNPSWGAVAPQLTLQSSGPPFPTAWYTFDIFGGGAGGKWVSASTMIGEDNFAPWLDPGSGAIVDESLEVAVAQNDITSATLGYITAFVHARRIAWTGA